jgi:homopolymeric O-antigen transport system ATP-binding protein
MDERFVLEVEKVSKKFCRDLRKSLWYGVQDIGGELLLRDDDRVELRTGEFWALKDVSFKLRCGEALGLIGRNGAGKTSLLRLLDGLMKPDRGRIVIRGSTAALIELGAGFDPVLSGRENIYINAALLNMGKRDVDRVLDQVIDFAGIGEFVDSPLQNYSAGMRVRLGFAVAAHVNPCLLIVDEVLAVGDMSFQRKCLSWALRYLRSGGSLVLVSHNMHLIQSICSRCILLDQGEVKCDSGASEAIDEYFRLQAAKAPERAAVAPLVSGDDGPVMIESAKIEPIEGDAIKSGKSVRLTLDYKSQQNLSSVTWGFSIWTKDQEVRIATCFAKYNGVPHCLIEGRGTLSCVIPKLPLVPGVFALRAGIYDMETAWPLARIGWEGSSIRFLVQGAIDEANIRHFVDGDIVTVEVEWGK